MPVGGAADRAALALGNGLVGNSPETPALEVCLTGPSVRADVTLACVVFGAPFDVSTPRRTLPPARTFTLPAGEVLSIGGTPRGARAYLCVRGGLVGPSVLGSQSSLQPLASGTELGCAPGHLAGRWLGPGDLLPAAEEGVLRVLPGTQADWFPAGVLDGKSFVVSRSSNRMGLRLEGEPLPVSGREMISEPVCPGAVQVTRDGQCIVLGVDGQTIGGYPKVAQVIVADLDRLGQLRPGERVAFQAVALDQAEALSGQRARRLEEWRVRLALVQ